MYALIFDMDGVISDTQMLCAEAESRMLREVSISMTPAEITRRFAGVRSQEWIAQVVSERGLSPEQISVMGERRWQLVQQLARGNIREIPGACALIHSQYSRDVPLAVASASRRAFVETVLSSLGVMHCFRTIISADDVAKGKPDPTPFLAAAKGLGYDPSECVVIEDAENGMVAAKAAGMRCIGLVPEGDSRQYSADYLVHSITQIPVILYRL